MNQPPSNHKPHGRFPWRFAILATSAIAFTTTGRARDITVQSAADVSNALNSAQAGDTLIWKNGSYSNQSIHFVSNNGRSGSPIKLRAETIGGVTISGTSRLFIGGQYLAVEGFRFSDGTLSGDTLINFRSEDKKTEASHCSMSQCTITNYKTSSNSTNIKYIQLYGTNNRIDHCEMSHKTNAGPMIAVFLDNRTASHVINRNRFADFANGGGNGYEAIRVGDSNTQNVNAQIEVSENYFYHCNGEIEVVSNKSSYNRYLSNTFYECGGQLTLRHGNYCLVDGNRFYGGGVSGSSGVRVIGIGHVVTNNLFHRVNGTELRAAVSLMAGQSNAATNGYQPVRDTTVAYNTFVDVAECWNIGSELGSSGDLEPENTVFANNVVSGASKTLVIVRGTPKKLSFISNIVHNASIGISNTAWLAGLRVEDPKLQYDGALYHLQAGSPAINAASTTISTSVDIDGQSRDTRPDIGNDEYSTGTPLRAPATESTVGPLANGSTPTTDSSIPVASTPAPAAPAPDANDQTPVTETPAPETEVTESPATEAAAGDSIPPMSTLWIEAEEAASQIQRNTWSVLGDNQASGGLALMSMAKSMNAPKDNSAGNLRYDFTLANSGTLTIAARILTPRTDADSLWIRLTGHTDWTKWDGHTLSNGYHWAIWNQIALAAGSHRIEISCREPNLSIDRFALSTAPNFSPINQEPAVNSPSQAPASASTPDSGSIPSEPLSKPTFDNNDKAPIANSPVTELETTEPENANGGVWIEAEEAVLQPGFKDWAPIPDANASGGFAIESRNKNTRVSRIENVLSYDFDLFQEMKVAIWVRTQTPDKASDSVWVQLEGIDDWDLWTGFDFDTQYHWNHWRDLTLPGGSHRLQLSTRENRMRIDRILVTGDLNYWPN